MPSRRDSIQSRYDYASYDGMTQQVPRVLLSRSVRRPCVTHMIAKDSLFVKGQFVNSVKSRRRNRTIPRISFSDRQPIVPLRLSSP